MISISPENHARIEALVASVWPQASLESQSVVQGLWNDYGAIVRVALGTANGESPQGSDDAAPASAIIKLVAPGQTLADIASHPRGWNTDSSRKRKIASYKVEKHFYDSLAERCTPACRVAQSYATHIDNNEVCLVLEDLDRVFPLRHASLSVAETTHCINWLAGFHARFMGIKDSAVWPRGTYWHLHTRQDEYDAMPEGALKTAAPALDAALFGCEYQTLLHGDAKVANFCFGDNRAVEHSNADASSSRASNLGLVSVAAVDFQYTGFGCGMQDLTYFLGSCLDEYSLETHENALLDTYFQALHEHLGEKAHSVEAAWRPLYPVAAADFHRFLLGWSPGHKKLTGYSERLVTRALRYADGNS